MIIDDLKNAKNYYGLSKNLEKAFKFLENNDLKNFKEGIFKIEGDDIYMNVQAYETKPIEEGKWEAHKKYIDIQYMIEGEEKFGFCNIDKLQIKTPYNEEKDVYFLDGDAGEFVTAKAGEFLIFYPQDAHMPCLSVKESKKIKKTIVKIIYE